MSKPWNVPTWFAPEDTKRYEELVESLHEQVRATRRLADRINPASERDLTLWEARMSAMMREAEGWVKMLDSLLRAPSETPTVEP